ncbi:MAG: class II aldolase/adducin family protein [Erysipelotrichaceae bacterium]|jgi:L-ribulose-5-phosphate 4-epimerase|nr:class II aldolase/adducin family protein [Erysipelotrichaceae bacterium]
MFSKEKQEIIEYGIYLDRYGLVSLTCGNLAIRMPTGEILVTPSGLMYEKMVEDDVIVCDIEGNIIEGDRKPSSDTPAILYIFKNMPEINGVIHTHQPYATAISLIPGMTEFRVCYTGMANACCGNVPIAPPSPAGSVEMGYDVVNYAGKSRAVILGNHGVMTIGPTLKDALYSAVYLEETAKGYLAARACCPDGKTNEMSDEYIQQMVDVFKYYGQGTPTIPTDLVKKIK